MPKLDGMNPGPVRKLLAELRQAAKEMRSVDARVTQLLSNASLSAPTTYRPVQMADDVDKMIRDVEARLALLEKEEKQKKPSVNPPDAMGERKPADDPAAKPDDAGSKSKGEAERRGSGEGAGGKGEPGESGGKDESDRRGSGEGAGGKGEPGDSGGEGEAERRGSGEGAGGKGEPGDSGGKGEAERRGSGEGAGGKGEPGDSGGKGEAERRGSGEGAGGKGEPDDAGGKGESERRGSGENAGGKGGCAPDGTQPDASGDGRTDKGDRADAGNGGAIPDTGGKDHPDDIPAGGGLRVIEVDGVKVVTGSLQPPSEAYLRWLEQNMDKIQPIGMPAAEDGRLGTPDGAGPRPDGPAGRMEPAAPDAGGSAGDGAGPSDASRWPITDREVAGVEPGAQHAGNGGAANAEDAFARDDIAIVNRDGVTLLPYLDNAATGDGAAGADANGRQERAEPTGGARPDARYGEPYPSARGAALGQEGGPFTRDDITLMPYLDGPADGAAGTGAAASQGQGDAATGAAAGARTDGTGIEGADGRADGDGGRCDGGERPGRSMGA